MSCVYCNTLFHWTAMIKSPYFFYIKIEIIIYCNTIVLQADPLYCQTPSLNRYLVTIIMVCFGWFLVSIQSDWITAGIFYILYINYGLLVICHIVLCLMFWLFLVTWQNCVSWSNTDTPQRSDHLLTVAPSGPSWTWNIRSS